MLDKKLSDLMHDITDWLKFAEAKNAALITFNGVCISFILKKYIETSHTILFCIYSLVFIISLIICLISFVPIFFQWINLEEYIKRSLGKTSDTDNLLFYKDIFKYNPSDYYKVFQLKMLNANANNLDKYKSENNKYEKYLVLQIVTLSGIAYKKYLLFNISLYIDIIAFILTLILIIIA